MINAKLRVAAGASIHASAGDRFAPSQLYFTDMSPSASNDALVILSTGPASFCCPSCAIAEKQNNKQSTAAPPALHFAMILRSCPNVPPPPGQYRRLNWHRTPLKDDPPSLTITAF